MKTIYYAIQNIIRGKDSTIIKVVSLSLGLFFSIIMFAMVGMQLGFNSFYQDNENIYAAETADSVSICLLFHKNPEVDMAEEFIKRRILVYSGVCYDTIGKNGCRFRVPAAEDMPKVMEALKEIDAID